VSRRSNKRKSQNVAESERAKKPRNTVQSAPETQSSSSRQPAPAQVPAIQQPPTPAVPVTRVNDQNREQPTSQRVANRAPLPDQETIRQATLTRVKQLDRAEITESNRAIYAAVSKVVKQNRTTLHTQLLAHIANLRLPGVVRLKPSAKSYYMVLFKSTEDRDKALETMKQIKYVVKGEEVPLTIHAFRDHSGKPDVIWTIDCHGMDTTPMIRDAVIAHLEQHVPGFNTSFTVREKMVHGVCFGEFAVRFEHSPPRSMKHMRLGHRTVLITQEPLYTCRFCGLSGHNIFQCMNNSIRSLDTYEATGRVGGHGGTN
jgi:hypothetical protein